MRWLAVTLVLVGCSGEKKDDRPAPAPVSDAAVERVPGPVDAAPLEPPPTGGVDVEVPVPVLEEAPPAE